MSSERCALLQAAAAILASAALVGCDSLSDVGDQKNLSPTAVAEVVGYDAPSADGNVTTDVRAQSELLLTGKDSVEADKPILSFLWQATNAAAEAATLTVRNTSTVAVSVPAVAAATEMQFRLTVTDSDGDTDTADVVLSVQPALDSNRFLNYAQGPANLRVVAGTAQPLAAAGQFRLELKARVTYRARSETDNTVEYPVGGPIAGTWLASTDTTDQAQADFRNPLYEFPVPPVDLDAITRQFQQGLPSSAPQLADPAFTDLAKVEAILTLTPTAPTTRANLYVLDATGGIVAQASNAGSGAPVELTLSAAQVEDLRIAGGGLENSETAVSYYKAIDPNDAKTTLDHWLTENCFDPAAANFGADAHAVYVNNFDLGFGRDMYFRTTRPANCASASFGPSDAAAVVINYPTLEAAAKKIDPIIAVAMEYHAADVNRSAPGLVTFYTFAPDLGAGGFLRVNTANFDGRGEKYLPGACTVCHGGRPKAAGTDRAQTYSAASVSGQDVGATFMPWDLESFLYSDTDSAFPTDASNAALRAQFTRAQQEGEFKKLNLAAHSTYGSGSGAQFQCYTQFGGPCELVELWYGGAGTPSANFVNGQVVPGWAAGGSNPATAPDLYLDVFARHCRACHTQRVFPLNSASDPQFRTYSEFVQTSAPAWRDKVIDQVFHIGGMPDARLTMDRLWQTGSSAGQILAEHLGLPADTHPGPATPCFDPVGSTPQFSTDPASRTTINRHDVAAFSSECSNLAGLTSWRLVKPSDSAIDLTANQGVRAAFSPDKAGDYDLIADVANPAGAVSTLTKYAHVENLVPVAPDLPLVVDRNVPKPIDVLGSPGDLPSTVHIDSVSGTGLSATLDATQRIVVTAGPAAALAAGTVNYSITDVDGNADAGVITVQVNATINVSPPTTTPRVLANSTNNQIDLTDSIAASGAFAVTITSNPRTSLVGTNPPQDRGDVSIGPCANNSARTCAVYEPPRATISHFGSIRVGTDDTFVYRACLQVPPNTCDSATVTVEIGGQFPFAPVATLLRSNAANGCFGCHGGTSPISGASWNIPSGSDDKAVWCQIRTKVGVAPDPGDVGQLLVNPGTPAGSLLYAKPAGTITHGGSPAVTSDDLEAILNWIGEGGALTSETDQSCP